MNRLLAKIRALRHERICPYCHGSDGSHTAPGCPGEKNGY